MRNTTMAFQPIPRERVIAAIEHTGPTQPLDLVRELHEGDSVLLGAILSEMASNNLVAISKTKRGGSPFYYLPGKPETLEKIGQYLKEKDRRTWEFLRENPVVREDELDPLTRVSLQNIPDFSRRFMVGEIGYWRYYLLSEEEARKRVAPQKAPTPEAPPQPASQETTLSKPPIEAIPSPKTEALNVEEKEEPVEKTKKTRKARAPKKSTERKPKKTHEESGGQTTLTKNNPPGNSINDTLLEKLHTFAQGQGGLITNSQIVKKDTEITCTLTVSGPFGNLSFFVVGTAKKVMEKNIMQWLLQARQQGMPLFILTTESYTKKVETICDDTTNVNIQRF